MDRDKERQEISLIGRFLSLEALLVVMGLLSLVSGIVARDKVRLLCGILILASLAPLVMLRKRKQAKDNTPDQDKDKDERPDE